MPLRPSQRGDARGDPLLDREHLALPPDPASGPHGVTGDQRLPAECVVAGHDHVELSSVVPLSCHDAVHVVIEGELGEIGSSVAGGVGSRSKEVIDEVPQLVDRGVGLLDAFPDQAAPVKTGLPVAPGQLRSLGSRGCVRFVVSVPGQMGQPLRTWVHWHGVWIVWVQ